MSLAQIDPITLAILRMACFELRHRIDVPYRVVINESLNLAKNLAPPTAINLSTVCWIR